MNTLPNSPVPRPVPGIDIRRLPIGPQEAFVFSRVDGQTTLREIGYATSLPEDQVKQLLDRLESLGAIDYGKHVRPLTKTPASRVSSSPSANAPSSAAAVTPPQHSAATGLSRYDAQELNAPADLDVARKRDILELYHSLDSLDHYELLGVSPSATKREIKAAYYEKVKVFHPDRYFGKNIGAFRSKIEQCFSRLTDAHDTLTAAASREEYDAYLGTRKQAKELECALSQTVTIDDLALLEQQLGTAYKVPVVTSFVAPVEGEHMPTVSCNSVIDVAASVPSSQFPKMSDEERKRFLARKLRVSSANLHAVARTSGVPPPTSSPPPSREQLAEQLRRQLGASRREGQLRQLQNHLATADAAMAANDPVAASNALRVAQSLAPDDPGIADRLQCAQSLAAHTLSDTYLRQGQYEEKSGRFDAAARSYERAAQGKPTPEVWESAARCILEAGGDLRSAADCARKSIAMNSERAVSHLLLGRIFLAAHMLTSAVAELERARRLDPNDDTVASLLNRIANDEI